MKAFSILIVALLTTASAVTYPLSIKDDTGRTVLIKEEPKRIVAMLPSHTETLVALGLANKIVGIDKYSNYPAEILKSIPVVGSAYSPNLESIVALKPDLVLADESKSSKLTPTLSNIGLNVFGGTAQTYNEVFEKIALLAKINNRESEGIKLITRIKSDLNILSQRVKNKPTISVYYEIDPKLYSVSENSFIGALIKRAGGKTIAPNNIGDFPKLDNESIIKANPQVIIGMTLEEAKKRPAWNTIDAVKNGRVYKPTPEQTDALSRPGPRLPVALASLIQFIHPK